MLGKYKITRLGQILHTAMANFSENGVQKRFYDVYYGLKKIQWKPTMDSRDPVVVFFEKSVIQSITLLRKWDLALYDGSVPPPSQ